MASTIEEAIKYRQRLLQPGLTRAEFEKIRREYTAAEHNGGSFNKAIRTVSPYFLENSIVKCYEENYFKTIEQWTARDRCGIFVSCV